MDFARDIQPMLAAKCLSCHGRDPASRAANLRLDIRDEAIAERRRGAAIVPGSAADSVMIARVQATDPDDRMPPDDHAPLTPDEVDLLSAWIDAGAPYADHWAWQPLSPSTGTIDEQITAALPDGLEAAPPTDTATWLRRVSFDLTGLPPLPNMLQSLHADDTPEARAQIVDSLLKMHWFGQHWARHWLDAFSYAETCGHEFDYPLHGAWRFRDWLVNSLNDDVPWGRITQELLAGDLIDPRIDPTTGLNIAPLGTGFWCMHQAVHAPVDVLRDEDDHRSDQLDALGRGLLGVTISCARCHDHKFDPISARDYQGLANMMRSSRRVLAGADENAGVAQHIDALAQLRTDTTTDVRTLEAWITAAGAMGAGRPMPDDAPVVLPPPTAPVLYDFESESEWFTDGHAFAHAPAGTWYPTAAGPRLTQRGSMHSGLLGTGTRGTAHSPEFTIDADRVHWRVRGTGELRVIVDDYIMDTFNALLFEGHRKTVDAKDSWTTITHDVGKYRGHRAYLQAADTGDGTLEIDAVACSDEPPWAPAAMDRSAKGTALINWRMGKVADDALVATCNDLIAQSTALPAPITVLRYRDATIVQQPVYDRGDPAQLGAPAPRAVPDLLGSADIASGSGRLELAQAVTAPSQPLLWRTAANRIWHHLMGRGFTDQIDDLGAMGTPPTHPALLDTLAATLAQGGTVKQLVRQIVLSDTYAQSSARTSAGEAIDPLNHAFHRANVRRLTGEQVRDALLSATCELDSSLGGPPVPIHLTASMTGRGRPGTSGPMDGDRRRSLYLEVRRNFAVPMMEVFDRPTPNRPCGRRTVSNLPAQSLTLMNDPFVRQCAQELAALAAPEEEPVQFMATKAWGRTLSDDELVAWTPVDPTPESLTDVAHAMFCAKAFVFLP